MQALADFMAEFRTAFAARNRVVLVKDEKRRVLCGLNTAPGQAPYRITSFDERGPIGHAEHRDIDDLGRAAYPYRRLGYQRVDR